MGKFNITQNAFSIGEVSPRVKGRTDLKEYKQAADKLQNMVTLPTGGVRKRPGLVYLHEQASPLATGSNTSVIPFNPDDVSGYYIVLTTGATSPDSNSFKVYKIYGTVCTTVIDSVAGYPLYFPSTLDRSGWRFAQSADVLFMTHSSGTIEPVILKRTGDTQFELRYLAKEAALPGTATKISHPFQDINTTSTTLSLSGTTLTASASLFTSADLTRHISISNGATDVQFRIVAYASSTSVVVTPLGHSVTSIAATTSWRFSAWGGANGYPTQVTMHNQRLCWMATLAEPNKVWTSAVGNLFRMSIDYSSSAASDSSDAFNFAIAGSKPNRIVWCEAGPSLKIGTTGEEYIADFIPLDDNSSSYATVKQQTSHGGSDVMSVNIGTSTIFVARSGRELRQYKYNDSNGSFVSINLNILSDHFFETYPIRRLVWQESEKVLWVLSRNFDTIHSLTIDEDAQTYSWAEHKLGFDSTTGTSLLIEDVCTVVNGTKDELILSLNKTILFTSDTPVITKLAGNFSTSFDKMTEFVIGERPYYLDCAIRSYDATAKTVHSGFDIFDGDTVYTLVDGAPGGTYVVSGGEITLPSAANEVIAGYQYAAGVQTMPIDEGGTVGDSVATVKRVDEASIRFHRTYTATFGDHYTNSQGDLEQIEFANDGTLYSGIKTVKMPNGYETDGDYSIVVEDTSPTPMSILSITYKGQSGN